MAEFRSRTDPVVFAKFCRAFPSLILGRPPPPPHRDMVEGSCLGDKTMVETGEGDSTESVVIERRRPAPSISSRVVDSAGFR